MLKFISAAWAYRNLIWSSIKSHFVGQFARSKLGFFWLVLNPLAQVAIYALILSKLMAAKSQGIEGGYGYVIYLMAGILSWTLFAEIVSSCTNLFIEKADLLKKIAFPKICLPLIVLGRALINNIFLLTAILLVFSLLGHVPGSAIIWFIPVLFVNLMFAFGVGITLGVINVFIRDVGQIMNIVLQFWFWLTPIVYMASIIPERFQHLLALNPMYSVVTGYQKILVFGESPFSVVFIIVAGLSAVLLFVSLFVFRRASAEMVDAL